MKGLFRRLSVLAVLLPSLFLSSAVMAASNNFLQFNPGKANQVSDAEYSASGYRTGGAASGVAPSNVHNKLFYQLSTMAAAWGQVFMNRGYDVSDASLEELVNVLSHILLDTDILEYVGVVKMYAGSTAPAGYLMCDGTAVDRTTYAALFAAIGTAYGTGDGSTTFNLPDLRGRSPMGAGQGSGLTNRVLGTKIGEENHLLTVNEMPSHNHGGATGTESATHTHSGVTGGMSANVTHSHTGGVVESVSGWGSGAGGTAHSNTGSVNIDHTHSFTTGVNSASHTHPIAGQGGGAAHNNVQPNTVVNFIIKY